MPGRSGASGDRHVDHKADRTAPVSSGHDQEHEQAATVERQARAPLPFSARDVDAAVETEEVWKMDRAHPGRVGGALLIARRVSLRPFECAVAAAEVRQEARSSDE